MTGVSINFSVDFRLRHAEDCAVHIDILAAGQLRVEAGADLQHGRHAPTQPDLSAAGSCNAGNELQKRGFPCAIVPDNPDRFTGLNSKAHPIERQKALIFLVLTCADLAVWILFAPQLGYFRLKLRGQSGAANGAETVFLGDVVYFDHRVCHAENSYRT